MSHRSLETASLGKERHVICVDDDIEFLRSLEFFLPEQINQANPGIWYRFAFFHDPADALQVLAEMDPEEEPVAMIITDQMMPGMKGTEFLMRAREVSEDSVRLLLTGHAGIESAITAINERLLDRYLTKPIESEQDFTVNVRSLLQKYELRRTVRDQSRRIHELYEFANTLNAEESLAATLQSVASFAARVLGCRHVTVIGGPEGMELTATAGEAGMPLRMVPPGRAREKAFESLDKARVGSVESLGQLPILDTKETSATPGGALYGVLRVDADRVGVIVATGPADGGFHQQHVEILSYVASTASVAVHNQVNRGKLQEAWGETRKHAASLAEANGRLRILDQLKSDFLGFISHELRTPLSSLSAVEMIGEAQTELDAKEMAQIVKRGYERLQRFINKGLEYFSWLAATREIGTEETELAEVLRSVLAEANPGGTAMDLELSISGAGRVRMELGPAREIALVLLDNAVKFSSGKPRVRVALESGPTRVRLVVQDQGRGFPMEWSTELFQPFTIVESMRHREGTALSLAKVAAIVQAHGGEIRAHSAGLGTGATFTVELPAADAESGDGGSEARRAA